MEPLPARAVVVREPRAPALVEEILVDPPGPGEVRVKIVASGVCHTDLHAKLGNFTPEFPYLLGHEATGVVDALGEGVASPALGETVVLTWRAPCGRCRACVAGRPAFCVRPRTAPPRMRTRDGKPLGRVLGLGTFTTHTVVAAAQAIPIAADLPATSTCLIGCCVATGVGAAMIAGPVTPGATVAVWGVGAVGMSVIMGARLALASRIIAVDLNPAKLEQARRFGATDAIDARTGDPAKRVRELTGGGVNLSFEAVGLPETLQQAATSLAEGGTCVLIGVPVPGALVSLSMVKLFYSRATIKATFCGDTLPPRDFPLYADLYRRGQLDLDALVSKKIALEDADAAFAAMERGETLRSVIVF